jgi:hypothetical protein
MGQRLPITTDAIDSLYIKTLLVHLDPNHIEAIIQRFIDMGAHDFYDKYPSHHVITTNNYSQPGDNILINSLMDYIIQDTSSTYKQILLTVLIQDGHFIDSGYPVILGTYIEKLEGFIKEYELLINNKKKYLAGCYDRLNASIYGQHDAKNQILRILGQWLNGNQSGYCLGFEGSPGIGKTSLAKYGISQALVDSNGNSRPFGFIALGGSSNGSTLEGHSYTYVGSTWGRIVDILITSKCMNPIIFIDELDKISNTESGRELIGILTHLTDKTQNNESIA